MIAYLDASALVKRYLTERGSQETIALTAAAEISATSIITRAEVAAALAKAARTGLVSHDMARNAQRSFVGDWHDLVRVPITEALMAQAEALAWEQGLRGYDAVQLACALTWRESAGEEIVLATFDQQLWEAAKRTGLKPWPEQLLVASTESRRRRGKQEGTS
ncbi:MAG: type II toxin-antitoxin system VapC family toxin [Vicinamibacterales bacterium]